MRIRGREGKGFKSFRKVVDEGLRCRELGESVKIQSGKD
jgi:hypothetical protein